MISELIGLCLQALIWCVVAYISLLRACFNSVRLLLTSPRQTLLRLYPAFPAHADALRRRFTPTLTSTLAPALRMISDLVNLALRAVSWCVAAYISFLRLCFSGVRIALTSPYQLL